jgi:membrane protein YdbS with pleckstrin-like domain
MFNDVPSGRLDRRALSLWRVSAVIEGAVFLALAGGVSSFLWWREVPLLWVLLPVAAVLLTVVISVAIVPTLRWKHWRYEVRELEVDLQSGIWTITRTLIPMARIQHVDTRRGPLQQRLGLASVVLYTAAGASEIPALALDVAADVRDRIAALANTRDDV